MKYYKEFINENQKVFLGDKHNGFFADKKQRKGYDGRWVKSISYINNKIKKYIDNIYGPYGYKYDKNINIDININGLILNTEYISKMVNNYTVFKTFIKENKVKNQNEFYNLLESRFDDVYHFNGDFFKRQTLPILINTTRKGNINEIKSLDKFKDILNDRNINIEIINPSIIEDIKGIDAKFVYNGKMYTIQVKPFSNLAIDNSDYKAKSDGSLSLGVDYLILYKEDNYIILKNPKNNPIKIDSNYFVYNQNNIIFSSI
jgi:hypothetical protein